MEITLQSLLDEIARDGGDLAALLRRYSDEGELTAAQITALVTEARTSFADLRGTASSEADLEQLQTIADTIVALNAEDSHLTEIAETRAATIAEIASRAGVDGDAGEGDAEGDAGAEGEGEGETVAETIANAEVVDLTTDPPADAGTDAAADALAASSAPRTRRRVNLGDIARRTAVPPPPANDGTSSLPFGGALVASAEASGVRAGHMFGSWAELGAVAAQGIQSSSPSALVASANAAKRSGREFRERSGLVQLRREYPQDLVVNDPSADSKAILDRAADLDRIPGGADALVAATGWCSPSETLYELCELPCALEGILSLPEINAPRGGVRWTQGIDFCDIYAAAGYFHYTEAELMANPAPVKPCMEIPCVDFNECRLEVDGMCIVGDIPQARAYPEVVSQFLQGATCARAHRTNAMKIARIAAGSTDDGLLSVCGGATASLLGALDLKIMEYRYKGLRSQSGQGALLEMPLPFWVRGVIRGDLANRRGYDNPFDVTDAQIDQWFRSRGVIVRWVYDWQPLPMVCATPAPAPVTAWPTQVEIILYEAGTWVLASQDVISLENLYDSTLIRQNKFTALFVEDAWCLLNRCNGSVRFQVPICPSGAVGAELDCTCGAAPFSPLLVAHELQEQVKGPELPDGATVIDPADVGDLTK